jgi:hypothetical protein
MTGLNACPTCGASRPSNRAGIEHWCCSIACYRSFHGITAPSSLQDVGAPDVATDERDERADAGALDPRPEPLPASLRQR